MLKLRHLACALVPALLVFGARPGWADQLEHWQFNQNQFSFTTDVGVQPRAQLVADPTRLVIDLPGIQWNRPPLSQPLGPVIQTLRIAQFDPQTTRIVLELAPGYTLNPQQIRIEGLTADHWQVDLPTPELASPASLIPPSPSEPWYNRQGAGGPPLPQESPTEPVFPSPPATVPTPIQPWHNQPAEAVNRIEAIELGGSELLIRTTGHVSYSYGPQGYAYRVSLFRVHLAPGIRPPTTGPGSPLTDVKFQQHSHDSLTLLLYPASGVQVTGVQQLDSGSLLVRFQRTGYQSSYPTPVPNPQEPVSAPLPLSNGTNAYGWPAPLPTKPGQPVVVIDPGHGGDDTGAVGIGGLREEDVVLATGLQVRDILASHGVQVYITRTTATQVTPGHRTVTLHARVALAEEVHADAYVSIHCNAIDMSHPEVNGVEVYYYFPHSEALAEDVDRAYIKDTGGEIDNRGLFTARFFVIDRTTMPSILIETGFVTGAHDAPLLRDPTFETRMAEGIAQGILKYLQTHGYPDISTQVSNN